MDNNKFTSKIDPQAIEQQQIKNIKNTSLSQKNTDAEFKYNPIGGPLEG